MLSESYCILFVNCHQFDPYELKSSIDPLCDVFHLKADVSTHSPSLYCISNRVAITLTSENVPGTWEFQC